MNKLILTLCTAIFIGCSTTQPKGNNFTLKVVELTEIGYTKDAAELLAKVELGYIKPNKEYYAIIND